MVGEENNKGGSRVPVKLNLFRQIMQLLEVPGDKAFDSLQSFDA